MMRMTIWMVQRSREKYNDCVTVEVLMMIMISVIMIMIMIILPTMIIMTMMMNTIGKRTTTG